MHSSDIHSTARAIRASYDLLSLACRDTNLKQMGRYYVGPCPFCNSGVDRFTVKQTGFGFLWICRKCGSGKYEDAISYVMKRECISFTQAMDFMQSDSILSDKDKAQITEKAERVSIEQRARAERKANSLIDQKVWDALHSQMDEDNRTWWRYAGVPDEWQDYLSLGYTPDKPYKVGEELLHSPAYTIPYFHFESKGRRVFKNLQYRLISPYNTNDKYRFEYGLSSTYYMVTPTVELKNKAIICEGAKKAIVTHMFTSLDDVSVLAVPSKSDFADIDLAVKQCSKVWVVLDPDAGDRAVKLAKEIGSTARVVELPVKIDDAILDHVIQRDEWLHWLETQAVKV